MRRGDIFEMVENAVALHHMEDADVLTKSGITGIVDVCVRVFRDLNPEGDGRFRSVWTPDARSLGWYFQDMLAGCPWEYRSLAEWGLGRAVDDGLAQAGSVLDSALRERFGDAFPAGFGADILVEGSSVGLLGFEPELDDRAEFEFGVVADVPGRRVFIPFTATPVLDIDEALRHGFGAASFDNPAITPGSFTAYAMDGETVTDGAVSLDVRVSPKDIVSCVVRNPDNTHDWPKLPKANALHPATAPSLGFGVCVASDDLDRDLARLAQARSSLAERFGFG